MWFERPLHLGKKQNRIVTEGDRVLAPWSEHSKEGGKGQHVHLQHTKSMENTTLIVVRTSQKTKVSSFKWESIRLCFCCMYCSIGRGPVWSLRLSGFAFFLSLASDRGNKHSVLYNRPQYVIVLKCIHLFGCSGARSEFTRNRLTHWVIGTEVMFSGC